VKLRTRRRGREAEAEVGFDTLTAGHAGARRGRRGTSVRQINMSCPSHRDRPLLTPEAVCCSIKGPRQRHITQ
jgi:hypothetical protein